MLELDNAYHKLLQEKETNWKKKYEKVKIKFEDLLSDFILKVNLNI